MGKGFFQVPTAYNEPIKSYAPGSSERDEVLKQYKSYFKGKVDVPLYIGSEEIKTGNIKPMSPPHDHKHIVGTYHLAEKNMSPRPSKIVWILEMPGLISLGSNVPLFS